MQCTNHLKQFGLAIHNFHDTQGYLPPSALGEQWPSMYPLLYPYMEQQAIYDVFCSTKDSYGRSGTAKFVFDLTAASPWAFWENEPDHATRPGLGEAGRKGICSISYFICPSRRSGMAMAVPVAPNLNGAYPGPQTDYAFPIETDLTMRTSVGGIPGLNWWRWFPQMLETNYEATRAPFHRTVGKILTGQTTSTTWEARTTFSAWQDGTSNQLCLGEKYCRVDCPVGTAPDANSSWSLGDAGYLSVRDKYTTSIARTFSNYGIARGLNDTYTSAAGEPQLFGSAHPDICNFLLGDGSVRTIPVKTDGILLTRLADPIDGVTASVP